jgi:hypothetical protein
MKHGPVKDRSGRNWSYRGFIIAQDWNGKFFIESEGDRRLPAEVRYPTLEWAAERIDDALSLREKVIQLGAS